MSKRYIDINVDREFYLLPARTDKKNYKAGETVFVLRAHEIKREKQRPHDCITQSAMIEFISPIDCQIESDVAPERKLNQIRLSSQTDFPDNYRYDVYEKVHTFRKVYSAGKEEADYHYDSFHGDSILWIIALVIGIAVFIAAQVIFGTVGLYGYHWLLSLLCFIGGFAGSVFAGKYVYKLLSAPRWAEEQRRNEKIIQDLGRDDFLGGEMRVIGHRIHLQDQSELLSKQFAKRWAV